MKIHQISNLIKLIKSETNRLSVLEDLKGLPIETRQLRKIKAKIAEHIYDKTQGWVNTGPISKLRISPDSSLSRHPYFLLGCYEQEIHGILNEWIANPPDKLIDIGTSVGYYLVGLAKAMEQTKMVGYETEEEYRIHALELARYNGIADRIMIKGTCDTTSLNTEINRNTCVLCDCEGGELELLDPDRVPNLKLATILCEVHDFFAPGVEGILVSRFLKTHNITFIDEKPRYSSDYRLLHGYPEYEANYAISETRYTNKGFVTPLRFMYFTPKIGVKG